MSWKMSFVAYGNNFYPSKINYTFSESIDVGTVGNAGPYKGRPIPFGRATLALPDDAESRESLQSLCEIAIQLKPSFESAGADTFKLWVLREYENQCNEALSPDELRLIASLGCTLCYSAYETDGADNDT
jgi:hypothetical protein